MQRRKISDEDRLLRAKEAYSKTAQKMYALENRLAAKKLRESLDKNSPVAATIRALKGLLKAKIALSTSMLKEDQALEKAVELAAEKLNSAIRDETGVDVARTFKVRPGKGDDDKDNDPTPEMSPEEPVAPATVSA